MGSTVLSMSAARAALIAPAPATDTNVSAVARVARKETVFMIAISDGTVSGKVQRIVVGGPAIQYRKISRTPAGHKPISRVSMTTVGLRRYHDFAP
jgi:hypothetical protein